MRLINLLIFLLIVSFNAFAEDELIDAAEADHSKSLNKDVKWNQFDNRFFTLRVGGGFLVDSADYKQDSTSKKQMDIWSEYALRDARLLFKGRIKSNERLSYTIGYMYDGAQDDWRFRQTGLMVDIPEWKGNFFIGRTKEGFSTNKIMVGYHGWTNERSAANDAFIPILADGVKWIGQAYDNQLVYNVGLFKETITEYESYDKNDEVVAGRAVWLPYALKDSSETLHIALQGRYGTSKQGYLQYRSKPESFPAQTYAVDTGKFKATDSMMGGFEVYYAPGPLMFGGEYFVNQVNSQQANNPFFHGGEVLAAWIVTGETRPYNKKQGIFEAISPARSVFKGGKGAVELVLRYSYVDLDDNNINGGKFRRITPMVNWHLSDNARLEFVYGYSELDRFGQTGSTQYLQTRLQLSL